MSNDFNVSSPQLAQTNKLSGEYGEFGRLIETKVFGAAVDWFKSGPDVTNSFSKLIFDAFEKGDEIPNCSDLVPRSDCERLGVDYYSHSYIE